MTKTGKALALAALMGVTACALPRHYTTQKAMLDCGSNFLSKECHWNYMKSECECVKDGDTWGWGMLAALAEMFGPAFR